MPTFTVRKCPQCGGDMAFMGIKFRAPRTDNVREWLRIETAVRDGHDYGVPTVRKQKPKLKVSPQLRIALGVYGKRKAKNSVKQRS